MGRRNYLVEGVSGTGKTSVCRELRRRGFQALNGDTDLAHQGDPLTGVPTDGSRHEHHVWPVERVRTLAADRSEPVTFFCGGSRNLAAYADVFDAVFVLEVDEATLRRRLAARGGDEFGARPGERDLVLRLHRTGEDRPAGAIAVDATAPLDLLVDDILARVADPRA